MALSPARAGLAVVLNAAPARDLSDALAQAIDILVVNAGEAEALSDTPVVSLDEAQALSGRFRVVVVTAGGDGVAVAGGDTAYAEPGHDVPLVSTHGAAIA